MSAQQRKVALVTGATSGIGKATALLFGSRGVHVIVTGRDHDRGQQVVDLVTEAGGTAEFLGAVLYDAQSCRTLARQALARTDHIDILVNNAAIAFAGPTSAIDESAFDACYALNVKVPFYLVSAIAPNMIERGGGVIVNVSSMVASYGVAGSAVYSSSKAALNLLTKAWSAEFGPLGIRVNAVAPGPTVTEGTTATFAPGGLDRLADKAPARRVAAPEEVAHAIDYLASDSASFVHGAVLPVDGGRSAV